MDLQEELKALKQRIAELEEQVEQEKGFPQYGDNYWYINPLGFIMRDKWSVSVSEVYMTDIGNVFQTEQQAQFAVDKLKVESELRKFSRPFKEDENNYYIELHLFDKTLLIGVSENFQDQGVIYFESEEKTQQAVSTIGADRIKKYIFGVED